jgi:hypothetical protein
MRIRILPHTFAPEQDPPMLQNDPLRLPSFHFDEDPDPAFHFDADPDPALHFEWIRIRIQLPKMMPIRSATLP